MRVQFYISDSFSKDYLPFLLYRNILKNVIEEKFTKDVEYIYNMDNFNDNENTVFIMNIYSLSFEGDKNNYDRLKKSKAKIVLINTEFYNSLNVGNIVKKISEDKLDWNILEYNVLNMEYFKKFAPNVSVTFLPLIYNKYLEEYYLDNIQKKISWNDKDIDIFFYGSLKDRRVKILQELGNKYKVYAMEGQTGEESNKIICNLIERSKVVINILANDDNIVFDYYRNAILLANNCLLISEQPKYINFNYQKSLIGIEDNFIMAEYKDLVKVVDNYLTNYTTDQIKSLINNQTAWFKKHNMEEIIIKFFNDKLSNIIEVKRSIPLFKVFMSEDVLEPLNKILMSGFITQGGQVDKFEEKLQEYFNNRHVLTLNSATSGLTLALRILLNEDKEDNWPGFDVESDYVLSPALTCFATNASILANNCKIKWIDVDKSTANVSIDDIKNKLDKNTKIVYIVHWGGYPVDLDKMKELQEEHLQKYGYKFRIIEDCAHAFGATYNEKMLGSHGNICVFSLQAIKHLTTGDGGLIILPTEKLYERAKLIRWFGIDRNKRNYNRKDFRLENDIEEWGYKFHMNDINATIGLYNLPHIKKLLEKNRKNYMYLYYNLRNVKGVRLFELKANRETSAWLFTMAVERKNDFIEYMKENGITTSQVHNRNDLNTCVSEFKCDLPNITDLEKELICIPVGWWLERTDLDYMIEKIKMFYNMSRNNLIGCNLKHFAVKNACKPTDTGLGNTLYQICTLYALSKKYNKCMNLYEFLMYGEKLKSFNYNHMTTIFKKFIDLPHEKTLMDSITITEGETKCENYDTKFIESINENLDKNIKIDGYLQSHLYFNEYYDDLIKLFEIDSNSLEYIKLKYPILFDENVICVSVHIRMGWAGYVDYKFDYFKESMKYFTNKFPDKKICFMILSNDFNSIKDWFINSNNNYMFINDNPDYIDLWISTLCKHNIISHSTFAWWGAYLNKNKNNIVIYPNDALKIYCGKLYDKIIDPSRRVEHYMSNWLSFNIDTLVVR
jgi:dTDP-4-amino-4,6-dideoxygalactose transaminase